MVVLFCEKPPLVARNIPFHNEMNEPVMIIQARLFTSNYTNRVVPALTALLLKYRSYVSNLIYIFVMFLM